MQKKFCKNMHNDPKDCAPLMLLQCRSCVFCFPVLGSIDDYAKDGGEELFTMMHCVLIRNP